MARLSTKFLILASLIAASAASAQQLKVGETITVRLEDLPPPGATPSASLPPRVIKRPDGATLTVPPGFHISVFAQGLTHARWLLTAPNGDVFVAESRKGHITVLRDTTGTGIADFVSVFTTGFDRPHGMAIHDGYFYIADTVGLWRVPYQTGQTSSNAKPERLTPPNAIGDGIGHWTRNIVFAPKGDHLFMAIGSESNLDKTPAPRASIQEFAADGTQQRTFAFGLRNPVGIAFRPGTDELWTVVNERDTLGDGLVPDYLTRVQDNGFYGWPYSYLGNHPQPGFADKRPDLVNQAIVPDLLFRAHSAPLGLVFYDGTQFPSEYQGDAFVALHGSWNSANPTGYAIVRVPFKDGKPTGSYQPFLTGFRVNDDVPAQVWGRPVGLTLAKDGSLLVADDVGGIVWRVSYSK